MKRLWAYFLLLPPLAVVPTAFLVAASGHRSASFGFVAGEALLLSTIALPLAYVAQATYGSACLLLLRRLSAVNLWSCLAVGILPFAAINILGIVPELQVASVLASFGLAVALASWAIIRNQGHESATQSSTPQSPEA